MKKILITGASGLVGNKLILALFKKGHTDINILTRNPKDYKHALPVKAFLWDPKRNTIDKNSLNGRDTIINLAGSSIDQRWTKKNKISIIESRTQSTKLIMESIKDSQEQVKVINASAIGYYGNTQKIVDETDSSGTNFLAKVCEKWEKSALDNKPKNTKLHLLRIGVVLSKDGGMLKKILPLYKNNLGGKIGSGKQFLSWIHIDDLVNIIIDLIENERSETIINAVASQPVSNALLSQTLASTLNRFNLFSVPEFIIKNVLGEMSQIILGGQHVESLFLKNHKDVKLKFPNLNMALTDLLKNYIHGEHLLEQYQWINNSKEKVFDFFKEAKNLETITPKSLHFKILHMNTPVIQEGSLIDYKLKVHGFPIKWRTLISKFEPNDYFIDQQLKGPYKKWFHEHSFIEHPTGTLMIDQVTYKIPFKGFGNFCLKAFIKKDLNRIFSYRFSIIEEIFHGKN